MPLPVQDQFPEAEAGASAQASSSAPLPRPKISDPKHLSSLLDMLADGEGDGDEQNGMGGVQVEEIGSEDDEEEAEDEEVKV
jgi:hypothetical protein